MQRPRRFVGVPVLAAVLVNAPKLTCCTPELLPATQKPEPSSVTALRTAPEENALVTTVVVSMTPDASRRATTRAAVVTGLEPGFAAPGVAL